MTEHATNEWLRAIRTDNVHNNGAFMATKAFKLSYECVEQLHTWIHANCPCALENKEFLPGLYVIVEIEVETALKHQQSLQFQNLQSPSLQ